MSALDELALRYGIQAVSEDAFGKEHVTSAETKRALLHAMHVDAETGAAAAASLERLQREVRDRVLPPVLVAYRTRAMEVPVRLAKETGETTWTVTLEDGSVRYGTVSFPGLPLGVASSEDDHESETRMLALPDSLPDGYHRLRIDTCQGDCVCIVTPGVCWLPQEAGSRKLWGFAVQLYLLKSAANWGMGDLADLRTLVTLSRQQGADVVGLNPLHAMFPDQPEQASPYSPSDRLLLNPLYIAVEELPELGRCTEARALMADEEWQRTLRACRDASDVRYTDVARLKAAVLALLFAQFERDKDPERVSAFEAFHAERRELLDRGCLFQALRDYFTRPALGLVDCKDWPAAYRDLTSHEVQQFREEHADLVRFHLWLQWVADAQMHAAARACRDMAVGLFRDLAVGCDPSGAEVWSHPDALVVEASVGAPPDIWNPAGQNWGLPPLHPHAAMAEGYATFIELIRTNMRYAGALRIDHALALQRLYWIPRGAAPKDGAYVQYPMDDLIGILALESQRNRCLVIGEDLGTVPKGFRERMAEARILSYRLLFFERDEDGFIGPEAYPELALSVASSHDLPTLRGWWTEADLDAKEALRLFPAEDSALKARAKRNEDREALLEAFRTEGIEVPSGGLPAEQIFIRSAHRYLARTASLLTLVQMDDVAGEVHQVNIPGTPGDKGNWRRRYATPLELLPSDSGFLETGAIFRAP